MKRLRQLNEWEKKIFTQLQIDGNNDEESFTLPPTADPMFVTTPETNPVAQTVNTRSNITITRIQTPSITENVQSQLFESTIEQSIDQPNNQLPEQLVERLTQKFDEHRISQPSVQLPENQPNQPNQAAEEDLIFRPDTGAGTSRSFRSRALSSSSNEALKNGRPIKSKKIKKKSLITDVEAGTKYDPTKQLLLLDYTNIRDKYSNIKEDLFMPFPVKQPDARTLEKETAEYFEEKHQQHPTPPTKADKERAKRHGYVLGDEWKTQFTIKAFHGIRRVGSVIHQVAVEFSSGPVQWENVSNIKKNARLSLDKYFKRLNLNK